MTTGAHKVIALMTAAGLEPPNWVKVQRTHAGRHQRSVGWCVWIALDVDNRVVCGSTFRLRDLKPNNISVWRRDSSGEPELGPRDDREVTS